MNRIQLNSKYHNENIYSKEGTRKHKEVWGRKSPGLCDFCLHKMDQDAGRGKREQALTGTEQLLSPHLRVEDWWWTGISKRRGRWNWSEEDGRKWGRRERGKQKTRTTEWSGEGVRSITQVIHSDGSGRRNRADIGSSWWTLVSHSFHSVVTIFSTCVYLSDMFIKHNNTSVFTRQPPSDKDNNQHM